MKNEVVSIAKTLVIIIGGVLIANWIDRKFLSSKISLPNEKKE
jgi:hypothetical protein